MKRYVASEFFSALDKINSDMDQYTETLSNVHSAILGVVNLGDNLTGQGGEALKNFYANNHVPLLSYWTMACQQVKIATAKMRMNALSFESGDAVIDESFIEGEVIPQLEKNQRRIQQHQDRINGVVDSVSDIVSLPKIDTSAIQTGIHEAKLHAMNTVEKLYAFDHAQSAAVDQLISLMAPISSFISGLNGAIESGVSITALAGYIASQDVPPEIKAMHPMLNGTYNVLNPYQNFKDQAVHTQNFLLSPNPFGFIHFSNPFIVNVAQRFYLASGHIDVVYHYSPDHQIAGTTVDANGNEIASVSEMIEAGKGQITYEWNKPQGDHIQARGVPVDYEALGIVPETVVVDGYAINYTVQDGQFILFRDNPDLEYYTQSAKRGKIETEVAKLTQLAADGVGTFFIYRTFDLVKKIPFVNDIWDKVIEKIPESAAKGAQVYGSFKIQESVPYWSEIVGTPVPDAGTEEVLVYISDSGGEEWNGRVLLTIHPDGNVTPRK